MKKLLLLLSLLVVSAAQADTFTGQTKDGRMMILQTQPCKKTVISSDVTPYRGYSFRLQKVKPGQTSPQEHFCWGIVSGQIVIDRTEVYPSKLFVNDKMNESNVGD